MKNNEEKLHNKTLAIARSLMEKDPSLKDWVISKFPELKESEDEKIRIMLIEIVRQWKNGAQAWCNDDKIIDNTLDWLNKHGTSVEWTKKDDFLLEKCIEAVCGRHDSVHKDEQKKWLNSLKYRIKS